MNLFCLKRVLGCFCRVVSRLIGLLQVLVGQHRVDTSLPPHTVATDWHWRAKRECLGGRKTGGEAGEGSGSVTNWGVRHLHSRWVVGLAQTVELLDQTDAWW